jgi:hypothetical protein
VKARARQIEQRVFVSLEDRPELLSYCAWFFGFLKTPFCMTEVTRADSIGEVDEPPVRQRLGKRLQLLLGQNGAAGEHDSRKEE